MKTWNLKAPLYSLFRKPWPLCIIHKRETENIISLLHLIPQQDGTGLDLGCGVGHSMKLSEDSMPLIGLDSSFIMARQASKTTNRPVVVADALSHPFKSKSLCLIMAVGLIEYLEDSEKFFSACARSLQPGGFLLVTSSPPGLFTTLRKPGGNKIWIWNTEEIIEQAEWFTFEIVSKKSFYSQEVFLFRLI